MFLYLYVSEMQNIAYRPQNYRPANIWNSTFCSCQNQKHFQIRNLHKVHKVFHLLTIQLTEKGLKLVKSKGLTFYRCNNTKCFN